MTEAGSTGLAVSKDALLVAGAIVLGSLIVAGAMFAAGGKSVATAPAADQGAVAAQDNQAV